MKGLLYKLSSRIAISIVTVLLVFAPFVSLTAQAQVGGLTTAQATPANISTGNNSTGNSNAPVVSDGIFSNCGLSNVSACLNAIIYSLTIGIGSVFAYVAAYFFDITIQLSLNGSAYGLDFISTSWTTARDLANMAFLFILLYIAFTIIFSAETGGTMSVLAGVIVVALLVNFSFFFTRVVIDAGNILSLQFYNSIPAPSIAQTIQGSPIASTVINNTTAPSLTASAGTAKDLTASIMNMLNVQGLLNNNSFGATNGNFVATIFIYIAGAIILWILTVAFVTNGVKFLFRVVVLWFLIVASPIAFVGAAVQGINKGIFKQWRELLINHAFYPVAFMFIFLILNNFAVTMSSANGLVGGVFTTIQSNGSNSSWSAIGAALVSIVIRLVLVIAVIYVAMRASDGIKVYGSAAAEKAGGWLGGKFINTYGAVGRNTAGLAAYKVGQSNWMQQWAARDSVIGRNLWRGASKLGSSTFDIRAPLKAAGAKDVYGLNLKGANKGGYKGNFDARVKERETEAKKFTNELTDKQKASNAQAKGDAISAQAKAQAKENADARAKAERNFDEIRRGERRDVTDSLATNTTEQARVQGLIQNTKKDVDEAKNKEAAAAERLAHAKQRVDDLEKDGKTGTAEMRAALADRMAVDTEHASYKSDLELVTLKLSDHEKRKAEIENELNKLNERKKANEKEIDDNAAALRKIIPMQEVNETIAPRKVFADSIAGVGPAGRFGNMSRLGAWIPAADKAAAAKIKKEKSKEQKAAEALKELSDDGAEKKDEGEKKEG